MRLLAPADDQRAVDLVRAGREVLRPRPRNDDRARRHGAAVLDRLRAGDVDDRHARRQRDVRREDCAGADAHALGDDAAGAEEGAVLDDHGRRVRRLEHAADADTAREVHVRPDLGARADGRPGVDHRARADPGADVHEARASARRLPRGTSRSGRPRAGRSGRRSHAASAESCPGTRTARPSSARPCAGGSTRGSPPSPRRRRPTRRRPCSPPAARRCRAPRRSPPRARGSQHLLQDRDCASALGLRGHERERGSSPRRQARDTSRARRGRRARAGGPRTPRRSRPPARRARDTSLPRCRRPGCPSARRGRAGAPACGRTARASARRAPRCPRRPPTRAARTPAAPFRLSAGTPSARRSGPGRPLRSRCGSPSSSSASRAC